MMLRSLLFSLFCFSVLEANVLAQAPFYQDKAITVVLGGPPSGSADLRTRGVISTWRKHIPGNPVIVMQYMGGGGGRQAANHVFTVAKPDGLTVGSMGAALVTNAVLGATGVQYDIDKLTYLGTPDSAQHYLFMTYRQAGLDSLEKLRAASGVRIGGQSVGHPVYITGRLFAFMLGLKDPRFVVGFTGPEIDIAVERGEADARANTGDSMVRRNREWLEKKLIDIHAGIEIPKGERHPQFAQTPDLETFAKSEIERKILADVSLVPAGRAEFLPAAGCAQGARRNSSQRHAQDAERPRVFKGISEDLGRSADAAHARSSGKGGPRAAARSRGNRVI